MGSSGALVCSAACVLILLSSASTDDRDMEQREVTFDKIMQEMEPPEAFILQRQLDLSEILQMGGSKPEVLRPRGHSPGFVPHSFDGPPILEYPVQFPIGRPTSNNLQAICLNGEHRPSYSKSYFPVSGFSQQKSMADYVNKGESWLSTCCKGNQTREKEVTLCCATQAWELFVESFCEMDVTVKHRIYHCCFLRGDDMLKCFQNDAPNPNYEATEELPVPPVPSTGNFTFDPNACPRTVTQRGIRGNRGKVEKKPSVPQKVDMSFPPGRPTADNIERVCRDQAQRPLYTTNCLTGRERKWLARQAKTINRVERGFKRCCKKKQERVLNCADEKWLEELDKFCVDEKGGQVDFHCCLSTESNDRHNCFQDVAPDPLYNMTSATKELSLHNICDTHKIIKKKFPVGFPLTGFVNQCCPLSEDHMTACFGQKLQEIAAMCSSTDTLSLPARRCCFMSSQWPYQCISKVLMEAITKATTGLHQKRKKRCPLS